MNKPKHFRSVREFRNYMAECAIRDRQTYLDAIKYCESDKMKKQISQTWAEIAAFRLEIKR